MSPLLPALTLLSAAAHATVPDLYGAGARSSGMGGGGVALVEDGTAARLNPAGLSRIRRPTASIAFGFASESLQPVPDLYWDTNRDGSLDDRDDPLQYPVAVDDAVGVHLSAGRQIGGKFGVGLQAYVPTNRLVRFSTFEPELPTYFMYQNRPHRYVISAGAGGEIARGLSVGLAVDMLAAAKFNVSMTIDGTLTGDGRDEPESFVGDITIDVHNLELDLVPAWIPVVGFQWELGEVAPKLDGVVLGASYRGQSGLPIDVVVDLQANISVEDVGDLEPYVVAAILGGQINLFDHYSPATLNFGAAWRTGDALSAYVDVKRTAWSRMRLNVATLGEVDLTAPLVELDDRFVDGNDHTPPILRDTFAVRTGVELKLPRRESARKWQYLQPMVRGGFGYEPTPLVAQGEDTAYLDTDRSLFTLGAGLEFFDPFDLVNGPVRFDAWGQVHLLHSAYLAREADEPTAGYPVSGGGYPVGGRIFSPGVQWSFDF